jgi:hypothetical protein
MRVASWNLLAPKWNGNHVSYCSAEHLGAEDWAQTPWRRPHLHAMRTADLLAAPRLHSNRPAAWHHRWPLIQRQIRELDVDCLCCQEVQEDIFEQHLQPYMAQQGYDSLHHPRV